MGRSKACTNLIENHLSDAFDILNHIRVPEAQNLPSQRFEMAGALLVSRAVDVLTSIQLDGEFRLPASEINDISAYHVLTCEPRPVGAEDPPQHALRVGCISSQRPRIRG